MTRGISVTHAFDVRLVASHGFKAIMDVVVSDGPQAAGGPAGRAALIADDPAAPITFWLQLLLAQHTAASRG